MSRTVLALALILPFAVGCVAVDADGRPPARIDWALANQGVPGESTPEHHAALDAAARAAVEESQGRWGEAHASWTQVLAKSPDDVAAALGAARACHALGRVTDALAVLERALTHHPKDERLARAMGLTQLAAGKTESALGWLRPVADAHPDDAERAADLLATLVLAERTDEAVVRALPLAPRLLPYSLRLALGRAALLRDQADWAGRALASCLDDDPSDVDGWIDLGRAQILMGVWPSARAALQRALVLDARRPDALALLGHAWLEDGRPDEALRSYQAAIEAGASVTALTPLVERARRRMAPTGSLP